MAGRLAGVNGTLSKASLYQVGYHAVLGSFGICGLGAGETTNCITVIQAM